MVSTKLREMAGPIMWVVIIAFVATIFVSWGMGGIEERANTAGSVAGRSIDLASFDRMVQQERARIAQNFDESEIPPQQLKMIPNQVWEQQVSQIVLNRVVNQMHLGATAEEIFVYLRNNPPPGIDTASFFMTNGVFDTLKYEQFLNTPASYNNPGMRQMEEYTGQVIVPMGKLETLLKAGAVPGKAQVAQAYREEKEKAVISYAMVRQSAFVIDSSELTDAAIKEYYTANVDSFRNVDQAELYFAKIPKQASENDVRVYEDEMLQLRERIVDGGDFAAEASAESDDPGSAANNGELGWFGRGAMVPEFEQAAFSLTVGDISQPVRTQFGFHLIKVLEKRTTDGKEEVKAAHILRKIAPTVETVDSLEILADSLLGLAHKQGLKNAVAGQDGLVFDSTGLFAKNDMVYKVGYVSGMIRFAFENDPGTVCENVFLNNADALYIFEVKRRMPAGVRALDEVRHDVIRKLIAVLQKQKAKEVLEKALSAGGDIAVAQWNSLDSLIESGTTDTVSFNQYVAPLGYRNPAIAAAFGLEQDKRSGIIETVDGYAVVKPVAKAAVETIPWGSAEVEMVKSRLSTEQQNRIYYQWYLAYKDQVGVKSNIDKFYLD